MPPPWPPALDKESVPHPIEVATTTSTCDPHSVWIAAQVALWRNVVRVYQDLVGAPILLHRTVV